MEQGANCPAAGGPLCVCADYSSRQPQLSQAHAAHSQRRFGSCEKECLRRVAAQAHAERD
jgi:hypothetical protein